MKIKAGEVESIVKNIINRYLTGGFQSLFLLDQYFYPISLFNIWL